MKVFKYWVTEKVRMDVYGEIKEITIYGGSNVSTDDAAQKARQKADLIKRKIEGNRDAFEEYEVEIREEILRTVDDHTVITRNRYGAQVMNAENLMFLDIDKPKATLAGLFRKSSPGDDKEKIFDMVRKLASGSKYAGLGFRIYETFQGARVIVTGRSFDPRELFAMELMREFNTDPLYAALCRKQGCFRARLTPKPNRIKMKAYKVKYPRVEADLQFEAWLQSYEQASRNFSVCKFVETAGANHGSFEAVRLHDDFTGAGLHLPLA
ncbi:MAG: hypothetical protein IPG80_16335 [Anaerolineales bacterium]|uniref:hypothetical protein n=1 Tax=Candidatus Villigracilis vicinus TaxID=3140679 RepID=UPI0031356497|nr:hypothetical protein [Anaerolineales bacterium]MBK9781562.1 hypothetical protein [Anaerolineales bacterium]